MILSDVPSELDGLTLKEQCHCPCIAYYDCVYQIKPGEQRGYSGHCANLPQNVIELADSLPRFTKDVAVILITCAKTKNRKGN